MFCVFFLVLFLAWFWRFEKMNHQVMGARSRYTEEFVEFLQQCPANTRVTFDQWSSFLEFSNTVKDDFQGYDEEGACECSFLFVLFVLSIMQYVKYSDISPSIRHPFRHLNWIELGPLFFLLWRYRALKKSTRRGGLIGHSLAVTWSFLACHITSLLFLSKCWNQNLAANGHSVCLIFVCSLFCFLAVFVKQFFV